MEELFLGLGILVIILFGFYLMGRMDRFLKHHYKSRRIEPDLNESSIVVFDRPNASRDKDPEEDAPEKNVPEERARTRKCGKCRENNGRLCICRLCRGFML